MIDVILWDLDGTLLDFKASEKHALRASFRYFGLGELSDGDVAWYSRINRDWWERMERGEVTKARVMDGRFEDFFSRKHLTFSDWDAFNRVYQTRLGDLAVLTEGALPLLATLKERGVRQYAVTNGTALVQRERLKKSGLVRLFDGVFISEDLGYEKPDERFFRLVFDRIGKVDRRRCAIVGDSVSGDMRGGKGAGIMTWLYRPEGPDPAKGAADRRIRRLEEVLTLAEAI